MYDHILVPLDGSELAEQVLPHVKQIAGLSSAPRITLLRAITPAYPVTTEYSGAFIIPVEEITETQKQAEEYLNEVAETLKAEGFKDVMVEVSDLPAAEAIIEYAEKLGVNLITIATHGRSGVSRWIFGSVTQKVLHVIHDVPLLVIRPTEHQDEG